MFKMIGICVCLAISSLLTTPSKAAAQTCTDGELQLVGGRNKFEGRLEICTDKKWKTICSSFNNKVERQNAWVACRQLGLSPKGASVLSSGYSKGKGQIHSKELRCRGWERRVTDCPQTNIDVNLCSHDDDVGIRCPPSNCRHGEVRLANSTAGRSGRVEVCINQQWGSVCDDYWDSSDATVVCRQLGLQTQGAIAISFGYFGGARIDPILLDNVKCSGGETNLTACNHKAAGSHNCQHKEDAGVICKASCIDGSIQLADKQSANKGRVEVCVNERWTAVCDKNWTSHDASVACQQLGYTGQGHKPVQMPYTGTSFKPIALSSLACRGDESRLVDCRVANVMTRTGGCNHKEDVGVECQGQQAKLGGTVTPPTNKATTTSTAASASPFSGTTGSTNPTGTTGSTRSTSPAGTAGTTSKPHSKPPTAKPARKLFNPGSSLNNSDTEPPVSRCSNATIMIVGGIGVLLLILLLVLSVITIWMAVKLKNTPKEDPRGEYKEVPQREVDNPVYESKSHDGYDEPESVYDVVRTSVTD